MAVGDLITTGFVKQYDANARLIAQQTNHALAGTYLTATLKGEEGYADQFGKASLVAKTERYQKKEIQDIAQYRRKYTTDPYWGYWVLDSRDKAEMLVDPTSLWMKSVEAAVARKKDSMIISALGGTAYTGKTGTTSVALPETQKIAHSEAGVTYAKIRKILQMFKDNDVMDEQIYIVWSPEAEQQALDLAEIKSSDYTKISAIDNGGIKRYMGMNFITSNLLPKSTYYRSCYAWVPSGVQLATSDDVRTKIYEDTTLVGNPWAADLYMDLGATRMEEVKVIEFQIKESASV